MFSKGGTQRKITKDPAETKEQNTDKDYNRIVEILIESGYFRARIASVNAFDKVVGGLCWCIQNSGEGVDADILFEENSTIGQKIRLSERIVEALRKMECPIPLQPHQIQGNDFPAIKPIIIWLINKYFETREATSDLLRKFSVLQFTHYYNLPTEYRDTRPTPLLDIHSYYKPQRLFRRIQNTDIDSEDARVQSCLLEFGEKQKQLRKTDKSPETIASLAVAFQMTKSEGEIETETGETKQLSSFERKYLAAQKAAMNELEANAQESLHREQNLLEDLKVVEQLESTPASNVGKIVNLKSEEIHDATTAYHLTSEERKKYFEANGVGTTSTCGQEIAFRRQKIVLEKQILVQDQHIKDLQNQTGDGTLRQLELIQQELTKVEEYNKKVQNEIQRCTDLEAKADSQAEIAKLKGLVMLNESLMEQETQFKINCRLQLASLKEMNAKLSNSVHDEEIQRLSEIEQIYGDMSMKYNKMRALLASRSQEISSTSRRIDDIPTRRELIQYERRFIELYEEVALKLDETRKYFSIYNTLDDTRKFIEKEVSLINSINDAFPNAMKTKSSKEAFLNKFNDIIKNVELSLSKQRTILMERTKDVDSLDSKYQLLAEKQREYLKTIKDFQDECVKNEQLALRSATK